MMNDMRDCNWLCGCVPRQRPRATTTATPEPAWVLNVKPVATCSPWFLTSFEKMKKECKQGYKRMVSRKSPVPTGYTWQRASLPLSMRVPAWPFGISTGYTTGFTKGESRKAGTAASRRAA